jgi:hypothetical protein
MGEGYITRLRLLQEVGKLNNLPVGQKQRDEWPKGVARATAHLRSGPLGKPWLVERARRTSRTEGRNPFGYSIAVI